MLPRTDARCALEKAGRLLKAPLTVLSGLQENAKAAGNTRGFLPWCAGVGAATGTSRDRGRETISVLGGFTTSTAHFFRDSGALGGVAAGGVGREARASSRAPIRTLMARRCVEWPIKPFTSSGIDGRSAGLGNDGHGFASDM